MPDAQGAEAPASAGQQAYDVVALGSLMGESTGIADVVLAMIDGPVADGVLRPLRTDVGEGAAEGDEELAEPPPSDSWFAAREHGTRVASILAADRSADVPGLCPGCELRVSAVLDEDPAHADSPVDPGEVSASIRDLVAGGARIINLSLDVGEISEAAEHELDAALDLAMHRGVIVVAAAGNDARIGASVVSRHPWVVPVVAYGTQRRPWQHSNLGHSIGRRGVGAPGQEVLALDSRGTRVACEGTSVAAPIVSGTVGLLMSLVPSASPYEVRHALTAPCRRRSVVPPLLNAAASWGLLKSA